MVYITKKKERVVLDRYYFTSILVFMNELISLLLSIKTEKEMREFLSGLLTPKEIEELPKRIQIVRMLKKGIPQHTIAKRLGVGVATVTRGSKEIQNGKFTNIA